MPVRLAAVRDFLRHPAETFPDEMAAAILDGARTSAVYLSQIERGERRAGRKLRAKLGAALGIAADLLDRDDD